MITLPALCSTREQAQKLMSSAQRELSPTFDLREVESTTQGFIDELCKRLMIRSVDRVSFVAPSERFMDLFLQSHRIRGARFIVERL